MYYLFHNHHILPGGYYRLAEGEKVILRAFFEYDLEQRELRAL